VRLEEFESGAMRAMLGFLGHGWDEQTLAAMAEVAKSKPNRTVRHEIAHMAEFAPEQEEQFREIAGGMMERLGYQLA
jgi:hypothetical protein